MSDLDWPTRECFRKAGLDDWPASVRDCPRPCVDQQSTCDPDNEASRDAITALYPVMLPSRAWFPGEADPFFLAPTLQNRPVLVTRALAQSNQFGPEYDAVTGGLALLARNLDVVEWLVCLLQKLAHRLGRFNPSEFPACMARFLSQGFPTYLINHYRPYPLVAGTMLGQFTLPQDVWLEGNPNPAFASATERIDEGDGGFSHTENDGVIIQVGHAGGFWNTLGYAVRRGGGDGLCAAVDAAGILLHELMHLCVDGELDADRCFALHIMLASGFASAMGQRYPCLQYGIVPELIELLLTSVPLREAVSV